MQNCPPPGIYHDVAFADYLMWQAISNSSLQAALKSMAHYKHQQPLEESPAMRLGTLCHSGKFEPLLIAQQYVVMPAYENDIRRPDGTRYDSPRSTAAYKELVADFKATNATKTVVLQSEYDSMLGVVRALAEHPRASEYLSVDADTKVEVALVWEDEETGLLCKGRVDCWKPKKRLVGDLKTTEFDLTRFSEQIARRSYHRQAAFYLDGLQVLTDSEDQDTFTITAVETRKPFGVRSAPLSEDAIDAGREQYRTLLRQIAEARSTEVWPGYQDDDKFQWTLPAWAAKTDDDFELIIGGETVRL